MIGRIVSPEETLERVSVHMSAAGVTRIADVTGLDQVGIPVVMVCRPNARSLSVAQGKGTTLAEAEASGLMESIEQYHAEHILSPLKLASLREMRDLHATVDPDRLPRTNVSRFHDDLGLLWIESRDLVGGARVWIPYELVHLNLTVPLPPGSGCFPLSSNGLASGNHPFETFIHGICEVIERDAVTLWHHASPEDRRRSRIDLSTVDDPVCRDLLERYAAAGVAVEAWDVSSEIGVPTFYARVFNDPADDRSSHVPRSLPAAGGMGCRLHRGVALSRALTEAAQSRLTIIAGSRDDLSRAPFRASSPEPTPDDANRTFQETPHYEGETLKDDLRELLDRLVAAGFRQVLAVDLAQERFGVPVARIVVPGLESIHELPNFVPGPRLREHLRRRAEESA